MNAILGGAMLPHAPQFFTLPQTEDRENVARVQAVASRIGEELKALKPEVWISVSNDHAFQFFQKVAPPFTFHVGGEARGEFAGRKFCYRIASELSFRVVRALYRMGFDPAFTSTAEVDYALGIPLTHMGVEAPVLPIFVNAYLAPQPPMERCYAFGRALAQVLDRIGVRAVLIASGGMSHFPGTRQYSSPNLAWDERALEPLRAGNLRSLLAYDEKALDDSGNVELRCWAVAAGALGERKPDIVQMNPSWHHNYASLAWWSKPEEEAHPAHYPSIAPHLVQLTDALHALANDAQARARFLTDRSAFASAAGVQGNQAAALIAMDLDALAAMGVHPLVSFLANMHLEQSKKNEHSSSPGSEFRQHELAGWDAKASSYGDYIAKVTGQVVDRLLHAAKVTRGTKLLDVATGPGYVAGAAKALGAAPLGIDFAPSMVAMARKNYPNVEFREGDAEALEFADASFDAVICGFGIGHLCDPDKGVREVFRVLKPRGRYAFSWWCSPEKHEFFALVQGAVKAHGNPNVSLPPAPPNFRFSDPQECERVLAAAGFKEVEVQECVPVYTASSAHEVLDLIYKSTVRTALVLERQTEEARRRINAAIVEGALRHRRGSGFEIAWPANVASGTKP